MIQQNPTKVISITNHQLDQSAISQSIDRVAYPGPLQIKQLHLHIPNTLKSRDITLRRIDKDSGANREVLYSLTSSTNESVIITFDQPIIIMDDESVKLEVTKLVAPASNTPVNGAVVAQNVPKIN